MSTEIIIRPEDVNVINDNGKLYVTSRDIAKSFDKIHKNVLRDIQAIECTEEFSRLNFEPSEYTNDRGKTYPIYNVTRDGFTFLVMGFTGKKAAIWKETYIKAFNMMEEQLRSVNNNPFTMIHSALMTIQSNQERLEHEVQNIKQEMQNNNEAIEQRLVILERGGKKFIVTNKVSPIVLTTRQNCRKYIEQYGTKTKTDYAELWSKAYAEMRFRYGVNFIVRAKNRKMKTIELIEKEGYIEQLYSVIQEIFTEETVLPTEAKLLKKKLIKNGVLLEMKSKN